MAVQSIPVKSSEVRQLHGKLRRWDSRLRLQQSVLWLPKGLLIGISLSLLLAVAARLWPLMMRQNMILLSGILIATGVIGALLGVWFWKRTPIQLARRFDLLFGLKERVSTALELAQGGLPLESPALVRHQFDQVLRVVSRVESGRFLPLMPRQNYWWWWGGSLTLLVALGLAIFLPNPQDAVLAQQAEVQEAIAETLEELKQLREEAAVDPSLTVEQQQAIIQTLDEAIQTLSQPGVTQAEALAALDTAQQELRDLSSQAATERQQALQQASGLLNGTAAQQAAEALAQGDFQAAGQALQNIDPASLTPEQKAQLAQALQATADEIKDSDPQTAQALEDAANALQSADAASLDQALDAVGNALQNLDASTLTQEQKEQLAQALQNAADATEGIDPQMAQALEDAASALQSGDNAAANQALDAAGQSLQDFDPSTMTDEQKEQLAQALQQAASAVQGSNPQAAQALQEGADALSSGSNAAAGQALSEAGQAVAGAGSQSSSQVDGYGSQVGKGQASVAGAGQGQGVGKGPGGGGNQPGQGGMGQTPGGGQQGAGQGGQQGQPGGGGAGHGEGGGDAGTGGQSGQMPTDNGPGDGGERDYEDIYSPQRIGGEGGEQVDVPGDPGAGIPSGTEGDFTDNPYGDSTVPYDEVWGDYYDSVNRALDNGYIPLGLRDLIRDYFGSLDPGHD